jgi:hypothetical protein
VKKSKNFLHGININRAQGYLLKEICVTHSSGVRFYETNIRLIVTFGAECWSLTIKVEKILNDVGKKNAETNVGANV